MEQKYLSVSALTKYLKFKFDTDEHLKRVFIKGEISNFKAHSTGHFYFSVKDENSKINAIMFHSNAKNVTFTPTEGSKVLITGRVSVYEATGSYQIYVDEMVEDGVGNLYIALEKLKKKLSEEGLFDPSHKRKIPLIPTRVGVVTAKTGAAVKDIISTIQRRFPICDIYLFPSLVQGDGAKEDIVKKIDQANQYDLDVLIVGRGGGSIEDLWPFNEEIVARAIYNSRIPVVSAVGHEIDYTIADYVADLRAPTPTGAAEMVVPNMIDLKNHFNQLEIRLQEGTKKKIEVYRLQLDRIKNTYLLKNPNIMYDNKRQKLDIMLEKTLTLIQYNVEKKKTKLNQLKDNHILVDPKELYKNKEITFSHLLEKLNLLNPLNVLGRGYSLTYFNGEIVKSIKQVKKEDSIKVQLADGDFCATIKEITEE